MKVDNVNSFVQGAQSTLTQVCGESGKLGKLFVKKPAPYKAGDVSIAIGFVGDLRGEVIYTMDTHTGIFLASKIMFGFEVSDMDEMAVSAVSELANMISGNAASNLFSAGVNVDITPPSFIPPNEVESFSFTKPETKIICLPMHMTNGSVLEIDLHIP